MSKIAKNIRHLRGIHKLSQEQLSDELNITRSRLGSYEEGRNEPPIELLIRISKYFKVAVDALVNADLTKTDVDKLMNIGGNRILFPVTVDKEGKETVEVVPVKTMAGYLNGYADPDFVEELPLMKLPFNVIGKHRAFPIKGDSMPPLETGDWVVAKYVEGIKDVKDNDTYVFLTRNEGLVYKRVMKNKDGSLTLISDNSLYAPYRIAPSQILEVWRYVCSIKMSNRKLEEINMASVISFLRSVKVEMVPAG